MFLFCFFLLLLFFLQKWLSAKTWVCCKSNAQWLPVLDNTVLVTTLVVKFVQFESVGCIELSPFYTAELCLTWICNNFSVFIWDLGVTQCDFFPLLICFYPHVFLSTPFYSHACAVWFLFSLLSDGQYLFVCVCVFKKQKSWLAINLKFCILVLK